MSEVTFEPYCLGGRNYTIQKRIDGGTRSLSIGVLRSEKLARQVADSLTDAYRQGVADASNTGA